MQTPKKRRSRHQRDTSSAPIAPNQHDLDILEAIYKRRGATTEQLSRLLFGRKQNTYFYDRLASLFHNGYLRRRFLASPYGIAPSQMVHLLDRAGGRLLAQERGYQVKSSTEYATLSHDFLNHSLAITDVEIAFHSACKLLGYDLKTWTCERFIKADFDRIALGSGEPRAVQPDSYAAITIPHKLLSATTHYLIEVDRGTEVRRQFEPKIPTYIAYFRSSQCRARYGTHKLRVLVVTTSDRRLANIKRITEKAGGKARFWFTTLERITQENPLSSPIWQVAGRGGMFCLVSLEEKMGLPQIWQPH